MAFWTILKAFGPSKYLPRGRSSTGFGPIYVSWVVAPFLAGEIQVDVGKCWGDCVGSNSGLNDDYMDSLKHYLPRPLTL